MNEIKTLLSSVLHGGDLLLIVPPFTTNGLCPGPHLLQAVAQEQGYQADILYLNLLLAAIIGFPLSEKLGTSELFQYWRMINERLFARSAYGLPPLGKSPEACTDEALAISGDRRPHRRMDFATEAIDLQQLQELEMLCTAFVEEVVPVLASLPYQIVGCSARMGQMNCSVALLKGIKQRRPDVVAIIGGANCQNDTAVGIASLSESFDYVFSGEGEVTFKQFLRDYAAHQLPVERVLHGIPVEDVNSLPQVNYESYFSQFARFSEKKSMHVPFIWHETSRGCWWGQHKKCTFCGRDNASLSFRPKSPDKVLQALREVRAHYPGVAVAMTDNIMPSSYSRDLLPHLAQKDEYAEIEMYYVKANLTLRDLIAMKQARLKKIVPGIESLSTELLTLLHKGVTARQNLQLLRHARSVGLNVFWFLLWGIPGDKAVYYEELLNLIPLIRHFQPPAKFFCLHLERNSSYLLAPEAYQISNLHPWEVYKMIYPEHADFDKLAFFFSGDYPSESRDHPELIQRLAQELDAWQGVWKKMKLVMIPFADSYMIYDNRGVNSTQTYLLDAVRARAMMMYVPYSATDVQQWAVQEKLAVIVDDWYVPLVTASSDVLMSVEKISE